MNDPYAVLGLTSAATLDEVKSAYRRLVRKLHPDVNPDPAATAEFKRVAEAYSTIEKRRKNGLDGGAKGDPSHADPFKAAFADFFTDMAKNGRGAEVKSNPRPGYRGNNIEKTVTLSLERAFSGGTFSVPNSRCGCERCDGNGRTQTREWHACPSCGGVGFNRAVNGYTTIEQACRRCERTGKIQEMDCAECQGTGHSSSDQPVRLTLEPGCGDGHVIKVRGAGEPGGGGRGAGDLIVTIKIKSHPRFDRQAGNLLTTISIPVWDAALGSVVPVVGIDGREVRVVIPAGTQSGETIYVAGEGMPLLQDRGDLAVTIAVEIPAATGGAMREKFLALKKASGN